MSRFRICASALMTLALLALPSTLLGAVKPLSQETANRLLSDAGGHAAISFHRATGAARFVRLEPRALALQTRDAATLDDTAEAFFLEYGELFGVRSFTDELLLVEERPGRLGDTRLTYEQRYQGVPVFGGVLRVHFDGRQRLKVVNGTFVPGIDVRTEPTWKREHAERVALDDVLTREERPGPMLRSATESRLVVFREGLVQGAAGGSRLAWEVEVGDGMNIRETLFVDAHHGKVLDRIHGVEHAMVRRAYDTDTNYPGTPYWVEGNPFPTGSTEANNMLTAMEDIYLLMKDTFGHDSWNDAGGIMHGIFNSPFGGQCPNASWNGTYTRFCTGVTGDDTVAHEWGHAFTDGTHDLIYQWQSGALNEAYSDFWGETVDAINGFGTDYPSPFRTVGACSSFGSNPGPTVTVHTPAGIAGDYIATPAAFGPALTAVGITADVAAGLDTQEPTTDACEDITSDVNGKIALVDRGNCNFTVKVANAQAAGAVAVIVANNAIGRPIVMGGTDAAVTIPSAMVTQADGAVIRGALGSTVNATVAVTATYEASYRWGASEDDPGFGGMIRDLWSPRCFADPEKVSDGYYHCGPVGNDGGGVHTNSGIPNHAFALLVDGGSYNGQTVTGIGLTKTAHLYWRAQSVYQVPVTNFADHADSLEQSCQDLLGMPLTPLSTKGALFEDGFESGDTSAWPPQVIGAADCTELAATIAAIELKAEPIQCAFQPLLDPSTPALCAGAATIQGYDFESGAQGWTVSRRNTAAATFEARDWARETSLPNERGGAAFFAPDPINGDCVTDLQYGVLILESPQIAIPTGNNPWLRFDHWVATEELWDGGNLKISVNSGPWTLVDGTRFTFNAYNATLSAGDNPMAGEAAFSGVDDGTSGGSGTWVQSRVDLTSLASGGDNVRLRFELGTDGCNGRTGWYVDDVTFYDCPTG